MLTLLNSLVQTLQTELQTWVCGFGSLLLRLSQDFSSSHSLIISMSHSHSHSVRNSHSYSINSGDGLVNGAMGTVVSFEWPEGYQIMGQQPCGIIIMFDDQRVGRQTRGTSDHVATTIQVTIRAATSRFNGKDGRYQFERYQYPIVSLTTLHTYIIDISHTLRLSQMEPGGQTLCVDNAAEPHGVHVM